MKVLSKFENMDFSQSVELIKEKCGLNSEWYVVKIDVNTWHNYTYFEMTSENCLNEYLADLIDSSDCKNGCELRTENDEVYLSILGSNKYDEYDNLIGTDEVRVYLRNFKW